MLKNLSEDSFSLQHCRMRLFVCSVAVLLSSYCLMFSKTSKVTRLNTEFPCVGDDHERMCDEAKRTCVHWSHWCDGNYDCANKADEDVTSCSHESSLFNEFAIDNEPPGLQAGVCLPNKQNHEEEGSCVLDDYPLDCTCHKGTWLTCNNIGLTAVPTHIRPSEILTKLVLRNNEITRIPTNAFSVYPNLTLIDLTGNKIHTVEPNAFAGLSLLKGLFLQNNQLDALPNGTFSTTTNLAQLYLSYNKFTDWNPDLFAGVRCLNQLYMIGSHIRLASDGLFQHLNTLRYLELAHNDIAEIKENTFNGLSLLKLLNLSDNAIHFISSTAFQKLKLSDLSLSRNKLSFLYPTTFADQQKLSDLDLSHNPLLNNLPEKWLYGMDNLVKLNLEGLQINNITKSMFSDPNSKLKFVQFGKFHYCNYAPHVQICTPKTDGISSRANLLDSQWLTIFSWIIGIVALVANLFVIGVRLFLWKGNNQMTKVHSLSIMNLAAADLVMGFYMFIISSADATYKADYSKHSYQWVHSHLCRFSGAISVVSFDSSALLLAYMAIERYIRLVYKPFAQKGLSLRTATECIVACWAFGLIAGILPLFAQLDVDGVQVFYGQNGVCLPLFIHEPFFKGWWMSTLIFIVVPSTAMLVVVCCYVSVFRHIEESRQATDRVSADKPHLKRVLTITISNLLCWVPIIILKAMAMAMFAIPGQVYSWMAVFILPLNCCINPIMYTLMTPECISAMKNCKWCNHTRNSSINSNSCCNTAFSVSTNGRVRSCASLTLRHAQSSATSISKTSASRMHSSRKPYKGLRRTSSLYAFRTNRSSRTSGTASYWLPPKSASTTCGNPQSTSDYESESLVHSPDGNTVPITTVSESVAIDMTAPGDVFKVGPFRWTLGD